MTAQQGLKERIDQLEIAVENKDINILCVDMVHR